MAYQTFSVPKSGEKITRSGGELNVPDRPILPFVEGDGTGRDIWHASQRVFDTAVRLAYGDRRSVEWMQVLAGEKSHQVLGAWLPDETVNAFKEYLVGIKSPLTTPAESGVRSLNVTLRK